MEITEEELEELLSELSSALGKMEPYYYQCGSAVDGEALVEKWRDRLPFTERVLPLLTCPICRKTFDQGCHSPYAFRNHLKDLHGRLMTRQEWKAVNKGVELREVHWATRAEAKLQASREFIPVLNNLPPDIFLQAKRVRKLG